MRQTSIVSPTGQRMSVVMTPEGEPVLLDDSSSRDQPRAAGETAKPSGWERHMPLLFSFGVFWGGMYINCVVQVMIQRADWTNKQPLRDLLFTILPHWDHETAADLFLLAFAVVTFARFAFDSVRRLTVLRRFMFLQGIMLALRAFSIVCTSLPNPFTTCKSNHNPNQYALIEAFPVMIGFHRTCNDVLFSGHTVNLTFLALFLERWTASLIYRSRWLCITNKKRARVLRWAWFALVWTAAFFGFMTIIVTHFHYTVDVFIGYLLTILLYLYYEHRMRNLYLRLMLGVKAKRLFHKFEEWFEQDSHHLLLPERWDAPALSDKTPGAQHTDDDEGLVLKVQSAML